MPPVGVQPRTHPVVIGSRPTLVRLRPRLLTALAVGVASLASAAAAAAATLTVNTTRDELVRHDGRCSLREAIAAVDAPGRRTDCGRASRRSNTIILRSGRYMLSIAPAD